MNDEHQRRITIPLPTTDSGKVLHVCPRPECEPGRFYLGTAPAHRPAHAGTEVPLRRAPGIPGTTCPYCGHDAPDEDFRHPDDAKYLDRRIEHETKLFADDLVDELVEKHLVQPMKRLERKTRGGFLQFKVTRRRGGRTRRVPPPRPVREDLLRNVACRLCSREYGVFAIALFCPDCGGPNLQVHLERERALCDEELASAISLGDRERRVRKIGNAHEDAVSITESYLKAVYCYLVRSKLPESDVSVALSRIGNAFQNVERGRALFAILEIDPYAVLSQTELDFIASAMATRHVVTHNLGIIDEKHAARTRDVRVGELVDVTAEGVRRHLDLLAAMIGELERTVLVRPPRL